MLTTLVIYPLTRCSVAMATSVVCCFIYLFYTLLITSSTILSSCNQFSLNSFYRKCTAILLTALIWVFFLITFTQIDMLTDFFFYLFSFCSMSLSLLCMVTSSNLVRWSDLLFYINVICLFHVRTPLLLPFYISTPLRQYSIKPLRLYCSTPLSLYACTPVLLFTSLPLLLYASTPLRLYASFSCTPVSLYDSTPSTPMRLYACTSLRLYAFTIQLLLYQHI